MEAQGNHRCLRVMLVPAPLQGHLTQMLQIATLLHSKGFSIIIAHTLFNAPNPSNHPDFVFRPIFDNLSVPDTSSLGNLLALFHQINTHCEAPFRKLMKEEDDQVVCIIYDTIMYFAEAVANHMNLPIPTICFRPIGASAFLALRSIDRLRAEGYAPWQESMLDDRVPGLHPLRFKDLPFLNFGKIEESTQQFTESSIVSGTPTAVIWNTIDLLEHSTLAQLQQEEQLPFFSVGPLHKMAPPSSTSLRKEDTYCISWLDNQDPRSVIYVSLGSLATIDKNELAEMAWALANCSQPFLWVIRTDSVRNSELVDLLPEGFKERIGERGKIVEWAPQKEVLAHGAVGAFWSHCGWNSTLESISEGVPLICMPWGGDQTVNARYLSHVWRVGVQLENKLDRGEIERAIRTLMVDKEGEEMRQRAIDMKEKVMFGVGKGGSSYNSLNDLAEFILSLTLPK